MFRDRFKTGLILLLGICFIIGCNVGGGVGVWAQEEMEGPEPEHEAVPAAAPAGSSVFDNLAVILLIDVSGSMAYTDPVRLRETAAGMFIDLLGAEDYLGVVIFDDRAEVIAPLGPAGSPADKAALIQELSPRLNPRGDTNYLGALELAGKQYEEAVIGGRIPVILLLTDGEPDPYPGSIDDAEFMEEYMESLWEQVDLLAREGILVYSVGFSEEIDPEIIRRIATDTRGKYYILQEPSELLLTFYRVLETLKGRRSFLMEEVDLGSEGAHTFTFNVEEYTRQINLVLVGAPEAEKTEMQVMVKPPRGDPENIPELAVGVRDDYVTVILSRPREQHYGTWEVEVTGSGEIQAFGNHDLYLEVLFIEPDPDANYPLYEPLDIRVEVITRERYTDDLFHIDIQVTGPEDPGPLAVPMDKDKNRFWGIYEYVDLQGEYELEWQLFKNDELFMSNSSVISVRQLPAITTDFWVDREGFRLGEQVVVSASLTTAGERMQQGSHLQVDNFTLYLEYRDGARVELELYDSGKSEHANSQAGDGIWSNRLVFDREGAAEALLTAAGVYRKNNFILKKRFAFNVSDAGTLYVRMLSDDLWAQPGGVIPLQLEITSESPFTQFLHLDAGDGRLRFLPDRVGVPPGEVVPVVIEMHIGENMTVGPQFISLVFAAEDDLVVVQPEMLEYEIDILTPGAAFLKRFSSRAFGIAAPVGLGIFLLTALFGGGGLLNRYYLTPRLLLKGHLLYGEGEFDPYTGEGLAGEIKLEEIRKKEVVISFDSENLQADYVLPGGSSSYEMIISNNWNEQMAGWWRGWRAFLQRTLIVETALKCTPPGVVLIYGKAYTRIELHHDEKFESGGYIFYYRGKLDKGARLSDRGVNILDGKL